MSENFAEKKKLSAHAAKVIDNKLMKSRSKAVTAFERVVARQYERTGWYYQGL